MIVNSLVSRISRKFKKFHYWVRHAKCTWSSWILFCCDKGGQDFRPTSILFGHQGAIVALRNQWETEVIFHCNVNFEAPQPHVFLKKWFPGTIVTSHHCISECQESLTQDGVADQSVSSSCSVYLVIAGHFSTVAKSVFASGIRFFEAEFSYKYWWWIFLIWRRIFLILRRNFPNELS